MVGWHNTALKQKSLIMVQIQFHEIFCPIYCVMVQHDRLELSENKWLKWFRSYSCVTESCSVTLSPSSFTFLSSFASTFHTSAEQLNWLPECPCMCVCVRNLPTGLLLSSLFNLRYIRVELHVRIRSIATAISPRVHTCVIVCVCSRWVASCWNHI